MAGLLAVQLVAAGVHSGRAGHCWVEAEDLEDHWAPLKQGLQEAKAEVVHKTAFHFFS